MVSVFSYSNVIPYEAVKGNCLADLIYNNVLIMKASREKCRLDLVGKLIKPLPNIDCGFPPAVRAGNL